MKEIPLSKRVTKRTKFFNLSASVDDQDYEELMKFNWHLRVSPHTKYAVRFVRNIETGKQEAIQMHRQIMGVSKGLTVDHKDHNGLNNQRSNLRIATHAENARNNTKMKRPGLSKYLGVTLNRRKTSKSEYFVASIRFNYKLIHIAQFPNTPAGEIKAAKAYDEAAKKYFGDFANVNFKD